FVYGITDVTYGGTTPKPPQTATVLLRRLACEGMPPDPNPTLPLPAGGPNPNYNPYVTVDYASGIAVYNSIHYDPAGARLTPAGGTYAQWPTRSSFGRMQPYASYSKAWVAQNPQTQTTPPMGQLTKHTFFRHNAREDAAAAPNATQPGAPVNS